MIIGPDVSFYQDDPSTPKTIDFQMMKNAGAYFVIIRGGQNTWGDRDFKVNWKNAEGKLPRGSYWFYDSRVDPKVQAAKWRSMFEDNNFGELPLWCDFEDNYNGTFKGWKNWYNFIEEVRRLFPGHRIGIYTGYYYWKENTLDVGILFQSLEYFKQYPLWIANYGVDAPLVPKPWTTWTLWQFTDNGNGVLYGVESLNIDLNYFNGDVETLYNELVKDFIDNPEIPQENDMQKRFSMTPMSNDTKLRKDHTTFSAPPIRAFNRGQVLEGDVLWTAPANGSEVLKNDKWLFVTHADGVLLSEPGWTAYIHKGYNICSNFVDNGEQIPDPVPGEDEDVIVNVDTSAKTITVTTEKSAEWKVFVDGVPFIKG